MKPLTLERQLARAALSAYSHPAVEHFGVARRHVVDCMGVALAGATAEAVMATGATFAAGADGAAARVLGTGVRLSPRDAAVVNGMAAHFHDYDDDDPAISVGHPTAPVLMALCAVADVNRAATNSVLAAYLCGVETTLRVGRVVNPQHYNAGWHATATLGVFGATVASASLLGLDEDALEHALCIAASLASGLKANFGSDVKSLQAGVAAGNGVWAAQLAASGVRGAGGAVFGPTGFCRVYGGTGQARAVIDSFGAPFGLSSPGFNIKRYPACSSTHTAVDGIVEIVDAHQLGSDDIASIDAWIGPDVPAILIYDVPHTALEAKFSLRYCLAAAAHFGKLGLDAFTPEAIADPKVVALMDRVHVGIDAGLPRIATGVTHCSRVRVKTRSGVEDVREIADPLGSAARPLDASALRAKFVECAARSLGQAGAERAFDAFDTLDGSTPFATWLDRLMRIR